MWYLETIYIISSDNSPSSISIKRINEIANGLEVKDGEYVYIKYTTNLDIDRGSYRIGIVCLDNKLEPGKRELRLGRKKSYLYFSDLITYLKYEPEKIVEYKGKRRLGDSFLGYIFNSYSDTIIVYNEEIPDSKKLLLKIIKREK